MPNPSDVPDSQDFIIPTTVNTIPAIGAPVHAAVPGVPPHDTTPEILAKAITDLFAHPDVVWSTDQSLACTGKANFLRITSNGDILLDVIKRGVRFSTGVHLDAGVDLEAIRTNVRNCDNWTCGSEGFLPEIVPNDTERVRMGLPFDPHGSSRPGAIYVFNRIRILQEPADGKPGLMLQWIGRHTNPAEGETTFKVEDELKVVKL